MDIPDEAWRGVLDFGADGVLETVEAATPVIARAAQVQILREMAEVFYARAKAGFDQAGRLTEPEASESAEHMAVGFDHAAEALEERALELEAGGGQTEEVQGDA